MSDITPHESSTGKQVYISGLVDRNVEGRSWWLPIVAGAVLSAAAAVGIGFGTRVISTSEAGAVLTAQVSEIKDDFRESRKLLQDILVKTGLLYTRDEARQDREAAERRFQSVEGKLGTIERRIETLEENHRILQRALIVPRGGR